MKLVKALDRLTCPICRGEMVTEWLYEEMNDGRHEDFCPFCHAPLTIVVETTVTLFPSEAKRHIPKSRRPK